MHGGFASENGAFLNLTFETRLRDSTNRAGLERRTPVPLHRLRSRTNSRQPCRRQLLSDPREYTFNRKNFRIGDAESEQYSTYYNASVPLGKNVRFYSFGGFTQRDNNSAGFYRRANQDSRVVLSVYPDGFLPEINTAVNDISAAAGIEWTMNRAWNFDISMNHGRNEFDFLITNSINASYGANRPRGVADSGGPRFDQTTFNFDVSNSGGREGAARQKFTGQICSHHLFLLGFPTDPHPGNSRLRPGSAGHRPRLS